MTRYNSSKIKPQRVKYKGIKFDSLLEMRTYQVIEETFEQNGLTKPTIEVHQPIVLIPKNNEFKPYKWKIDFCVDWFDQVFWVEAKGITDLRFLINLRLLSYQHPQIYENLMIVSNKKKQFRIGGKTLYTYSLSEFRREIESKILPLPRLYEEKKPK